MSIQHLVTAANGAVPSNMLMKPKNCHEAVLGWLLMAKYPELRDVHPFSYGVEKAWLTLRVLAERYGDNSKQLTGSWMSQRIYRQRIRKVEPPFSTATFFTGDILFMGNRQAPHHSMIVVQKNGIQALVRGFNNAGAFGGEYMEWDVLLRDVTDGNRWDANGQFMAINGPCDLYAITYDVISRNIPDNLNF